VTHRAALTFDFPWQGDVATVAGSPARASSCYLFVRYCALAPGCAVFESSDAINAANASGLLHPRDHHRRHRTRASTSSTTRRQTRKSSLRGIARLVPHRRCKPLESLAPAITVWSNLTEHAWVRAGLDLLVDLDYLAAKPVGIGQRGGRPKVAYTINPAVFR
jgi:hypothetical protein